MVKSYLLILVLAFFVSSCESSSSSPAIFKSDPSGAGNGNGQQKVEPPEENRLRVSVFSFDNLGDNFEDVRGKNKDLDENKLDYLAGTIRDDLLKQNDILVFNNIVGANGARHFEKIKKLVLEKENQKFPFNCISSEMGGDISGQSHICVSPYVSISNVNKSGYSIPQMNKNKVDNNSNSGMHASISIGNKMKFNLISINLYKDNDVVIGHKVRSEQIQGLVDYMKSEELKEAMQMPTIIIGDWQNTKKRDEADKGAIGEVEAYVTNIVSAGPLPFRRSSPLQPTGVVGDYIFNHILYSSLDWEVLKVSTKQDSIKPLNGGVCTGNYSQEDKNRYKYFQSVYCPTSFKFKFLSDDI